jgi:hypothetical protein
MSWLDRPIRAGDRFIPVTRRISSKTKTGILDPNGDGGGRGGPGLPAPEGQELPQSPLMRLPGSPRSGSSGAPDSSDYRLRIGVGRVGELTGLIEDMAGEWTSEGLP